MELNNRIISQIRSSLPEGATIATALSKVLHIGKESIYRRLRGEVSFSLDEVAVLSRNFKFSMDSILDNSEDDIFFDSNRDEPYLKIELYSGILTEFINLYGLMAISPHSQARYALNTLPFIFYLDYLSLSEFKYFKWLHQSGKSSQNTNFNEIVILPSIFEMQKEFVHQSRRINSSLIILDRNLFSSMQYDIEYFYQLQLIDEKALKLLQQEMLDLVDYVEGVAEKGCYQTGKEVFIYLSNIDIEASYSHFQYGDNQYAHLRLYGISGVETQTIRSCEKQKIWIDSLKRHSTLISASGQMQRNEYFKKQRESIQAMGNNI